MKEYYPLQFRMLCRHLAGFGLHPAIGTALTGLLFVVLSVFLFNRTSYAGYVVVLVWTGFLWRLSEPGRNMFLRQVFSGRDYSLTRMAENLLVSLPAVVILLVYKEFIPLILLILLSLLLAFYVSGSRISRALVSPFGRHPFEFPSGFRASWPLWALSLFLAVMAGIAGNLNLGIFAHLLQMLVITTFYLEPEPPWYVWIYARTTSGFLAHKIAKAMLLSTLSVTPVVLTISLFFPDKILILLAIQGLCLLGLAMVILARYSSFPGQISLPVLLILVFAITFPPLLLVVIPYLWMKSAKHIQEYLS